MSIVKACDFLNDKMPDEADIDATLDEYHLTGEQVFKDIQKALSNRKTTSTGLLPFSMNADDDNQSNEKENQSKSNGRGGRGSKATASKSTASKATTSKATTSKAATPAKGKGSTRSRTAASLNVSVRIC